MKAKMDKGNAAGGLKIEPFKGRGYHKLNSKNTVMVPRAPSPLSPGISLPNLRPKTVISKDQLMASKTAYQEMRSAGMMSSPQPIPCSIREPGLRAFTFLPLIKRRDSLGQ